MEELFARPEARAIFVVGLGTVFSIPVAVIGDILARLPARYLSRERMPAILAFSGMILGWLLARWSSLPVDVGMEVGAIAGGFSGVKNLRRNGT